MLASALSRCREYAMTDEAAKIKSMGRMISSDTFN
jgi:hypothetical protein